LFDYIRHNNNQNITIKFYYITMLPIKYLSTKELLSMYGKPVSFKDIGRVTNGEMPKKPPSYFISAHNSCYAPDMTFPNLKQHIETILSQVEGLKYKWDEDYYIWRIEWGTRLMEYDLDYKSATIIKHGRFTASMAACEAIKRFPHLIEDDVEGLGIPIDQLGSWCSIELRVYRDITNERIFIEFNKMTGDSCSYWVIWKKVKDELNTN